MTENNKTKGQITVLKNNIINNELEDGKNKNTDDKFTMFLVEQTNTKIENEQKITKKKLFNDTLPDPNLDAMSIDINEANANRNLSKCLQWTSTIPYWHAQRGRWEHIVRFNTFPDAIVIYRFKVPNTLLNTSPAAKNDYLKEYSHLSLPFRGSFTGSWEDFEKLEMDPDYEEEVKNWENLNRLMWCIRDSREANDKTWQKLKKTVPNLEALLDRYFLQYDNDDRSPLEQLMDL